MRESTHLGAAAVLGPDGVLVRELGDADALIYPRSTLKLVQAVALLRVGTELTDEQLALAAASHVGTQRHIDVVRSTLTRAGIDESALQCPADWPSDVAARAQAQSTSPIAMTCSGKHAAFLLACVTNGWPLASYLEPRHPLQLAIRRVVEDYAGETVEHSGVDGCGAPVHALTLAGLARATGLIARGAEPEGQRLTDAILANPWALDSPAIATVIGELGLVAKSGAEGVFVAAAPDGTAVALKMIDGSNRALVPVALALLQERGVLDAHAVASVLKSTNDPVLGGGLPVGEIYALV